MKPYIWIVYQDAGTACGMAFPDAPGCFSASDSLDCTFTAAEEALALWLETVKAEGIAIPQPRDLSDIRSDAAGAASFADAALVIAVPLPHAA